MERETLKSRLGFILLSAKCGWGWDNYLREVNSGEGMKMKQWTRGYLTLVLPCIVVFLFVVGIYDKFFG